jgi:hypothetical protein
MATPEEEVEMALFYRCAEFTDIPLFMPNHPNEPPSDGTTAHAIVKHIRAISQNLGLDDSPGMDYNEGMLHFLIRTKLHMGPGEMRAIGGALVDHFPKYSIHDSNGTLDTKVKVCKRPVLGTATPTDAWYEMTCIVEYEVFF